MPSNLPTIRQEKARRHLIDFARYTNPAYQVGWFNKTVSDALTQFLADVVAGKQPRLMIFAPPRHGKSELFSRNLPAFALGKYPDLQMIACSYSADLASRMNRDVQRIIDSPGYQEVFPDTRLNGKNIHTVASNALRNSEIFEIVGHKGAYRSAGVGGGITGMGADIAIIDDAVKDAAEANSQTYRDKVWEWYTTTLYTRLSPNSGILLGMTRWHDDDLAGRLLKAAEAGEGDQWQIIRFPAIAEHDEDHRCEGEALHPERYPVERLNKIKAAVGNTAWAALFQQRPQVLGGGLIRSEWFNPRYSQLPNLKWRGIWADTAQKTKEHNDYSVFLVGGMGVDGYLYVLDILRGKWEAPELERRATDLLNSHKAKNSPVLGNLRFLAVEDKASGTGLIQAIKHKAGVPVQAVQRHTDKLTRLLDVQGFMESGRVRLPANAPWVNDLLAECEAFKADMKHAHDDQVDTLIDAINDTLAAKLSVFD